MPRKILNDDFVLRNCPEYQPMGMPNAFLPKPNKPMMAGQELVEQRQVPQNATLMDLVNNVNLVPVSINERTEQLEQARARVRPVITGNLLDFTPTQPRSTLENDYFIDEFNRIAGGVDEDFIEEAVAFYDNFGERVPNLLRPLEREVLEEKEERGEQLEEKTDFTEMSIRGLQQESRSLRFNPLFLKEFDERIDYNQQKRDEAFGELQSLIQYQVLPQQQLDQELAEQDAYLREQAELQRLVLLKKELSNKIRGRTKSTNALINNLTKFIIPASLGERAKERAQIDVGYALLEQLEDMEKKGLINAGTLIRLSNDIKERLGFGTIQDDGIQEINNILELEKRAIEPDPIPDIKAVEELAKSVSQKIPVEEQTISKPEKLTTRMKLRGSMAEGL